MFYVKLPINALYFTIRLPNSIYPCVNAIYKRVFGFHIFEHRLINISRHFSKKFFFCRVAHHSIFYLLLGSQVIDGFDTCVYAKVLMLLKFLISILKC